MRHFGPEEQVRAVGAPRAAVGRGVVSRFKHLRGPALDFGSPNKLNGWGALAALVAMVSVLADSGLDAAHAAGPALRLAPLDESGPPPVLSGRPTILVFWRADCAPCLVELGHLRQLEAASGHACLALVALDDAPTARAKLKAMGLAPRHAWRLRDDPAATLSALGRGAPRLPLSAAYDSAGRACGLRIGLLGVDQVRDWARACS